jgi:predicted nucleic acid-binding protein
MLSLKRKFEFVVTTAIFFEYIELLEKLAAEGAAHSVGRSLFFARNIIIPEIYFHWNLITVDPDDNKFTDAYIAANADYLVTNDAHFNEVKNIRFPPVKVISADDFLEIVKKF